MMILNMQEKISTSARNIKNHIAMKKITTTFFLVLCILVGLGACTKTDPYLEMEETFYSLCIKFEDKFGNSLVDSIPIFQSPWGSNPLTVKDGKEVLVDVTTRRFGFKYGRCDGNPDPQLYSERLYIDGSNGGEWLLYNNYETWMGKFQRDTVIYELRFPAIFGDDDVHKMISYWTVPSKKFENKHYAVCNYIELDGHKLQIIQKNNLRGIKEALTNQITISSEK